MDQLIFICFLFIKPAVVRPFFQEEDVSSYDRAMEIVINSISINKDERNVLWPISLLKVEVFVSQKKCQ